MKKNSKILIFNGLIITPDGIIDNGCVLIEDGKISAISSGLCDADDALMIDAKGNYISPGFIDIHTHGGGGHDFMDSTIEAFIGVAKSHAMYGTTSLVPTTLTSTYDDLVNTIEVFKEAKKSDYLGAEFLGLHLEGPYFALSQKGAQDPRYIKSPEKSEYKKILALSKDIIRWSAAPELDGAMEFGNYLKKNGILASIAHTQAIYEEVVEAFDNGFTHVTHLYSGMSGVTRKNSYRKGGVIEAAYLIEDMTVEIIADGSHLPECLLKLIYKIKGVDNIALVTDSMRGAGMGDGESIIGGLKNGQKVIIEDNVAKLMDRTAFAGSVATTDKLVRNMINIADVPFIDAIKMMTSTPARIMGIEHRKGKIKVGYDADILIIDNDIDVKLTMVGGRVVHKTPLFDIVCPSPSF